MGHDARLIPPAYVKPFVKRNKNEAVDAEAIFEGLQRLGMRFVEVTSEEQQGCRSCVPHSRSDWASAHPANKCDPRASGRVRLGCAARHRFITMLADFLEDEELTGNLPEAARLMFKLKSTQSKRYGRSELDTRKNRGFGDVIGRGAA